MSEYLNRLLWRYEAGYYSENYLADKFEREIQRRVAQLVALEASIVGFTHRPSELISACDDAINCALKARYAGDYRDVRNQMRKAEGFLENIKELFTANREYEITKDGLRGLEVIIASEHLMRLITMKTATQLMSEVDKLIEQRRYREAKFISSMCGAEIRDLHSQERNAPERGQRLLSQLTQLVEVYDESERFVPSPLYDSSIKVAFSALRSLIGEKFLTLAERLIDDLEIELAPRRIFFAEYARYLTSSPPGGRPHSVCEDDLKVIISTQSWNAGSLHLMQTDLQALASELISVRLVADRAVQKLAAETEACNP